MQKQLPLAIGIDIGNVAMAVWGDMHVHQPSLAVADKHEAIGELAVVLTQGPDLRAGELDTSLEGLVDKIIMKGLFVACDARTSIVFLLVGWHGSPP